MRILTTGPRRAMVLAIVLATLLLCLVSNLNWKSADAASRRSPSDTKGSAGTAPENWVVSSTTDDPNDPNSLRWSVNHSSAGDIIDFNLACTPAPCVIQLTQGSLNITHALTINGPGSNQVTIKGGMLSLDFNDGVGAVLTPVRVFFIESAGNVKIKGLTIADGIGRGTDGGCGGAGGGGGAGLGGGMLILNPNSPTPTPTPTPPEILLQDVAFINNQAVGGKGGDGTGCGDARTGGGGGGGFGVLHPAAYRQTSDNDGNGGYGVGGRVNGLGGTPIQGALPGQGGVGGSRGADELITPGSGSGGGAGGANASPSAAGAGGGGGGRGGHKLETSQYVTAGSGGVGSLFGGGGAGGGGNQGGVGGVGGIGGGGGGSGAGIGGFVFQGGSSLAFGGKGGKGATSNLWAGGGGGGGAGLGAAIFAINVKVVLRNCSFVGNSATGGAAGAGAPVDAGFESTGGSGLGAAVFTFNSTFKECESSYGPGQDKQTPGGLPEAGAPDNPQLLAPNTICTGQQANASITFADIADYSEIHWSIEGGEINSTSGVNGSQATFTLNENGPRTLKVTVRKGGDPFACFYTYTRTVNGTGPQEIFVTTPPPPTVCAGSTGHQATAQAGLFDYSWSITGGTITSGAHSQTVTFTASETDSAVLLTVEAFAPGGFCVSSAVAASTIVHESDATSVQFADGTYTWPAGVVLSNPTFTAIDDQTSVTLTGNLPPGVSFQQVSIGLGGGVFVNAGRLTGTPTLAGNYQFLIHTSKAGCSSARSYTLTITCETAQIKVGLFNNNCWANCHVEPIPTGTLGQQYNLVFEPAGAQFSQTGTLPTGLTFSAAGLISGTPTQGGSFPITIGTTGFGCPASRDYTITIACPTITMSSSLAGGNVGVAYSQQVLAFPAALYTFSLTQGSLPQGITLDGATGIISGTTAVAGTYPITIKALHPNGCSTTQQFSLVIACPTVLVNPASLPGGQVLSAYSQTITALPAGTTYSFAVSSGAVPPGLTLSPTGGLTGTPTQSGTFSFGVTASGFGTCSGQKDYQIVVTCPTVSVNPASLPSGTASVPYSQTISATPALTYSFGVASGNLPPGLSLDPTSGALTGTPTTPGTFGFMVSATSASGCNGSRNYSVTIICPTITLSALTGGTVNIAYNQALTASPAGGNYTFTQTSGSLPQGLTLSSAGVLSGTPTLGGTFTFRVTASGFTTCSGFRDYEVVIACPVVALNPATLPSGVLLSPYNQALSGTPPFVYSFGVTSGSLPPGLSLDPGTGALTGTPTTLGPFNFTVTATNTAGCPASRNYSVTINCPAITLSALIGGTVASLYSQSITGLPAGGNYTFSQTSGSLPPGLALSAAGVLSGTPTQSGPFNFRVTASGFGTCSGYRDYEIVIACPGVSLNPATLASGVLLSPYNQTLNGSPPFTYSFGVSSGNLPSGLSLDPVTGALTGTPTAVGTFTFLVTAASTAGCNASRSYSVIIDCPVIQLNSLVGGTINSAYNQSIIASPAGGNYTYGLTGGSLPPGLSLSPAGNLTGTPTQSGLFSFQVKATGFGTCPGFRDYQMVIACGVVLVDPVNLPGATAGTPYSQAVIATPAGIYAFSVTGGSLPPGIALNPGTGALTGSPTAPGAYNFTVSATSGGCSGSRSYSITVACQAIAFTTLTLPGGTAGTNYSAPVIVTPAGSYTFAVVGGALPGGFSINTTTGTIGGVTSTPGTYTFTVKAQSPNGCNAAQSYSLVISCPTVTFGPDSLPGGQIGTAYNQTVSVTGGNYTLSFNGAFPSGLSLNALTGVLSGTPTANGTFNFNVVATAPNGCSASKAYSVVIAQGTCPTITLPALTAGKVGQLYLKYVTPTPAGSYTYSLTGALPAGLIFYPSLGLLYGYPSAAGNYNFTITATNTNNCVGSKAYVLAISP